jgi:hypothetical protein
MTAMEFWIAWAFNLHDFFTMLCVLAGLGTIIACCVGAASDMTRPFVLAKTWLPIAVIAGLMASSPSISDLWQLRLGLLKLELVSPENVVALRDHATEIVSQLECKHLNVNCPEKKKETK